MGNYGLKSSNSGTSVEGSVTTDLLTVTSAYPNPKIQINQTPRHIDTFDYTFTSEPGSGTTTLKTIPHGYSYTPMAWVLMNDDAVRKGPSSYSWFYPPLVYFSALPSGTDILYTHADSTNLYLKIYRTGTAPVTWNGKIYHFKYQIFAEDGV